MNTQGQSKRLPAFGRVPEWTKGADCKSVIRRFESDRGLFIYILGGSFNITLTQNVVNSLLRR